MTRPARVKQALAFLAILLAAMLLWHGPLVVGASVLCGGDLSNHAHPMRVGQLRDGWFAGWQAGTFSGRPVIDDPQSGSFYPPNVLHVLGLSVERTLTLLMLLHVAAGALGMFCLARVRFPFAAAALAGLLWAVGGYNQLRLHNGIIVFTQALAWLPWMVLAAERQSLADARGRRWLAVLAACGGLQILAGAPQLVQITWCGLALWTAGRLALPAPGERRVPVALGFMVAGVLALGVGLPLLAGAARLAGESVARSGGDLWAFLTDGSMQPRMLLTMLVPEFFGSGTDEELYWGSSVGYSETMSFIGSLPLVLALIAVAAAGSREWRRPDRWAVTLGALLLVGLLIALGDHGPLFAALAGWVPTFDQFRVPARWMLWPVVALILGAAWGMAWLLDPARGAGPARLRAGVAAAAAMLALLAMRAGVGQLLSALGVAQVHAMRFSDPLDPRRAELVAFATGSLEWALLIVGAGMATAAGLLTGRLTPRHGAAALLLLCLLDLFRFRIPYAAPMPDTPPREVASEAPYGVIPAARFGEYFHSPDGVAASLAGLPGLGRVHYDESLLAYFLDQGSRDLFAERPIVPGLEVTRGYQPLILESYRADYYASINPHPAARAAPFLSMLSFRDPRFLDAYNVTHAVGYELPETEPGYRAMGLVEPQRAGPVEEGLPMLLWRNPRARGWAWLSSSGTFLDAAPDAALGSVRLDRREAGLWQGVATVAGPAHLHLSSPDYSGWALRVEGPPGAPAAEVLSTRTVRLPAAGEWRFERRFRPAAFHPAVVALTVLSLLAIAACALLRSTFPRRAASLPTPSPRSHAE